MKFIALGATNSVGASCYFLQIDGTNLLLDCGKGILQNKFSSNGHNTFGPDFTSLSDVGLVSIAQIDAILISHGHYDHIGYLPEIIQQCPDTPIYATSTTKKLGHYLIMDNLNISENISLEQKNSIELNSINAIERIHPLNFLKPIQIGALQVTFYEAGHVPGAAMILIESQNEGSVLYTGDFRKTTTKLTPGYLLPDTMQPDILLMCGLHAKHPKYIMPDGLDSIVNKINEAIWNNVPCFIPTRELTKGIEIISFLADKMQTSDIAFTPIFVDDNIWNLNERLQEIGISVINEQCSRFPYLTIKGKKAAGIYIGGKKYRHFFQTIIDTKFSLHAGYSDCSELIEELNPATVILVHSPDDTYPEQKGNFALSKEHPDINFIYPQVGRQYDL
jgi:Cft2 family RNA processing exonuclease